MKLQVTQENLNRALNAVARVASSRGTLPILANVALKTSQNRLSVAATNLDVAITCFIGAKISQEGATTVPARLTQDFIASLPSGVIDLKLDGTKLNIKTDQYESTINSVNADDFPVMPKVSGSKTFELPVDKLKGAFSQVVGAAGSDETRPVLTGIYLAGGDKLVIAATDSYRLAEKTLAEKIKLTPIIIPSSAVSELLRVLPDTGKITVNYSDQQISFSTDFIELTARLIDGNYPPYQNLIPTKFTTKAVVARADLLNITKVSSLFARESAGSITINVDDEAGNISVHSIASQLGENTASANAEATGSGSITLNSRYLLDALGAMSEARDIFFGFNGKLEAVVVKDNDASDFTYVIMPLKS